MNGEANALVSGANSVLGEAKGVQGGISRKISTLTMEQTDAQAELDKTFFLNFGKKGTRAADVTRWLPRCLAASLHTLPSACRLPCRLTCRLTCRLLAVCLPSGEIKDVIKGLKNEIKAEEKALDKANKAVEKAQGSLEKAQGNAEVVAEKAAKVVAVATDKAEKVTAAAQKQSSKIMEDAAKKAAGVTKSAEGK